MIFDLILLWTGFILWLGILFYIAVHIWWMAINRLNHAYEFTKFLMEKDYGKWHKERKKKQVDKK